MAGGGRYDGLVKSVGGPDVPGVGFACGMERLALMLGDEEAPRPDFYAVAMDAQSRDLSFGLVQRLRGLGLKGEMNFSDAGFKGLMRQAGKSNARFCCIMGPDEAAAAPWSSKTWTAVSSRPCPWMPRRTSLLPILTMGKNND